LMRVDHRPYLLVRLPEIYPANEAITAHSNVDADIRPRS
jgi:hypothetical protein